MEKKIIIDNLENGSYEKFSKYGISRVWKYFSGIRKSDTKELLEYIICNDCSNIYTYEYRNTGTTSLSRHVSICKKRKSSQSTENSTQESNMNSSQESNFNSSHESNMNSSQELISNSTQESLNFTQESNMDSPQESIETSTIFTHQKKISEVDKKKLLDSASYMCYRDLRPFDIINEDGMKCFVQSLINMGAQYGKININEILPRSEIIGNDIKALCKKKLGPIISDILALQKKGQSIALGIDILSENNRNRSFLSIKCHYIQNFKLKNVTLSCKILNSELTKSENDLRTEIVQNLESLCFKYTYLETQTIFVSASSGNIESALKCYRWLPCIDHIISDILKHTFEEQSLSDATMESNPSEQSEELVDALIKVKKIIHACKELQIFLKEKGAFSNITSLNPESESTWNSRFLMLENILKEKEDILYLFNPIGETQKKIIENIDFVIIKDLLDFLKPFRDISLKFEDESYCTLHGVWPYHIKLEKHLRVLNNDSKLIAALKKRTLVEFNLKWKIHNLHKIATFLCPVFKGLSFTTPEVRTEIHNALSDMIHAKLNNSESDQISVNCKSQEPPAKKKCNNNGDLMEFMDESETHSVVVGEIDKYVKYLFNSQEYLDSNNKICGINILQFWEKNEHIFPNISSVAKSVLCVPATCSPSECAFSKIGLAIHTKRSNLSAKSINSISILNSIFKSQGTFLNDE